MKIKTAILILYILAGAAVAQAQTKRLTVKALGGAAPRLEGLELIKGGPVIIKKGSVYVVEFWATWCAPCKVSIPHLTELQHKYKDRKVTIIGVSTEPPDSVRKFVKQMGDNMDYTVVSDAGYKATKAYMGAFGVSSIPHAFIVDKKGNLVWHGYPMGEMDAVLEQVVTGTFDLESFEKQKAEARNRLERTIRNFNAYFEQIQMVGNVKSTRAIGEKVLADADARILNDFVWWILTRLETAQRDVALAVRAGAKANLLSGSTEAGLLDTYARALFEYGISAEAVRYESKAVELTGDNKYIQAALKKTVKKYQAGETKENIVGKVAPAWRVSAWANLPKGKRVLDVGDYSGKVVYLHFFQAGCAVCQGESIPTMKMVKEYYAGNETVAFVAIQTVFEQTDTNTLKAGVKLLQSKGLDVACGHAAGDTVPEIAGRYKAAGTPWTVIIGPYGIVKYSNMLIEDEQAQLVINELLPGRKEKKVTADEKKLETEKKELQSAISN